MLIKTVTSETVTSESSTWVQPVTSTQTTVGTTTNTIPLMPAPTSQTPAPAPTSETPAPAPTSQAPVPAPSSSASVPPAVTPSVIPGAGSTLEKPMAGMMAAVVGLLAFA